MREFDSARARATGSQGEGAMLACTFRLGDQWFGVDACWVQEVHTWSTLTPIPHAPLAVCGYVSLRGHLRLVLDLRDILGTCQPAGDGQQRLIVFKPAAGESFAIVVDQMGEIVSVASDQIDNAASSARCGAEDLDRATSTQLLLVGYAKLAQGLVTLLEPRRFLATAIHSRRET